MASEIARTLLSPVVAEIIKEIKSTLEKKLSKTLKGKLRALSRKMVDIHSKLQVGEHLGTLQANHHWQQEIKEVTFNLEYLLDVIEIEVRRRTSYHQVLNFLHLNLPDPNMIDDIKEDLVDLQKTFDESIAKPVADKERRADTRSEFAGGDFIGRKDEIKKIVEVLVSENNNDNNTCSIVGIGGVGKTALAQVVCQHEDVKKKLVVKWAHVGSKKLDLREILFRIGGKREKNNTLETQKRMLEQSLGTETCLFVLDDFWDIGPDKWQELKSMLLNINKGNKILITTRNQRIAEMAANDKTVFLKPLEPHDCLPLIQKFVKSDLFPKCDEIKEECEGVPLAAITLGIKLSEGTIRGGDIWSTEDVKTEGNIMNSLKFSYDYLPPRLKDCFAYHVVCNDLHKESLTQMWTAQGFIKGPDVKTSFEELQNASFFHDVEEDIFGGTPFKVLKLFRSLILLLSKEYAYAYTSKSEITGVSRSTRHVSLSPEPPKQKVLKPCLREKLRTVVGPHEIGSLSKFRGLRVLVLFGVEFESSATSLGNLKHLRYLDLSQNKNLEVISKVLGNLLFLETLRVMCEDLKKLPNEIDKLTKLRYLYASSDQASLEFKGLSSLHTLHLKTFKKLKKLPKMSYFTELETLEILDCPRLCFHENDMKDLKNLKRLAIIKHPNLTNLPEGFRSLTSLERLTIEDCPRLELSSTVDGRNILPRSLKLLRINRCDELTKRCESEEGRDDVSLIKDVYLNGVLINPVPNVEPSPSSSSAVTDVLMEGSNGGTKGNGEGATHHHQSDRTSFGVLGEKMYADMRSGFEEMRSMIGEIRDEMRATRQRHDDEMAELRRQWQEFYGRFPPPPQ